VHEYKKQDEQFVETDMQRLGKERDVGHKAAQNGGDDGKKEKGADAQMEDGEEKEDAKEEENKIAVVLKL
jgi:tRNA pseudouridine13 synthase